MPESKVIDASSNNPDILQEFQIANLSISQKTSADFGLKISKKIWAFTIAGLGGYYYNRNARFRVNRNYANGRIDVAAMFKDRLQMNGKQNYIRLNWQTLQIVNRIVSGLVGRWMKRSEKIQVTATDSISLKDKQDEFDQLEFVVANREKLEQLQAESGVQMIPKDREIPADQDQLLLWQSQFQRLPEEILYELGCNDILAANGWFDILKEKMLHDAAETLLVGTYTWMDKQGVVHVKWVKPENIISSYTEYADFRDTTWRGECPSLKISELRQFYGKEFNPDNPLALTEDELFKIAQTAKEYKLTDNLTWDNLWINSYFRPYDEWNVRSMCFELKTVDSDSYTITQSKSTGTTYAQKGKPVTSNGNPKKPSDNQKVIEDTHWNIYEGVFLPDNDKLIKWGLKKNMIRPQDPREIGNAEFSYSFNMPQNYEMRNLAIPEKIQAAVDGMILALLKMQQVVARMRPTGAAINESALQEIDYGLGDSGNKDVDYKKVYDQTGDIYYRGTDADGKQLPIPIQELANSGFLGQMDGLIRSYQFNYQTLKDELGEDPNLISAALQPRVTSGNVEQSQQQAEYATDYIYMAYANCMADTGRKISCLLKDSVNYGAKIYRQISKEDIDQRIFGTKIQFLPDAFQIQKFETIMNEAIRANPDLVLFIDPFQLMRVAKEDVKLAETLFRQSQKKMLQSQREVAAQNQKATIDGQVAAAKSAEEEKRKSLEMELELKGKVSDNELNNKLKEITATGLFSIYSKGLPIPAELKMVQAEFIKGMEISLFAENVGLQNGMAQTAMPENLQQMEQPQQPMEEQPLNNTPQEIAA